MSKVNHNYYWILRIKVDIYADETTASSIKQSQNMRACNLKRTFLNRKQRTAFAQMSATCCDLMAVGQSISYVTISPSSRDLARERGGWGKGLDSLRPRVVFDRNTKKESLKLWFTIYGVKEIFKRMKNSNKFARYLDLRQNKKRHSGFFQKEAATHIFYPKQPLEGARDKRKAHNRILSTSLSLMPIRSTIFNKSNS